MRSLGLLLALVALSACHPAGTRAVGSPPPQVLALLLSGDFSSAAQASADSAYYDIRLHVRPAWHRRADGPWLYVEQAAAETPGRPYRQRVYRLRDAGGGRIASDVYTLAGDPLRHAGVWRRTDPLAGLTPDSLVLRAGCTVVLRRDDRVFTGATEGTACASDLRGAAYATSEVEVGLDGMRSWDRGFDATGRQVWGATAGPYVFLREGR